MEKVYVALLLFVIVIFSCSSPTENKKHTTISYEIKGGVYDGDSVLIEEKVLSSFIKRINNSNKTKTIINKESLPFSITFDSSYSDSAKEEFWTSTKKLEDYIGFNIVTDKKSNSIILINKFDDAYKNPKTWIYPNSNGIITKATIYFSSEHQLTNNSYMAMHEIIHAFGFDHTCSHKTLMFSQCEETKISYTPTKKDIAYFQYHIIN